MSSDAGETGITIGPVVMDALFRAFQMEAIKALTECYPGGAANAGLDPFFPAAIQEC